MSSTWSIAELLLYRRTRFPLWRFGPLALFLALAAGAADAVTMPGRVLLALAWLFSFRLADDLADRRRDARDHPDRVLVRADVRPFFALLFLASAASTLLAAWLLPWPRWVELLGLAALFLLWYAGARCRPPLPGGLVVLLKYPAFVYLLSDSRDAWLLAGVLVLVYACFVAHEILHDRRLWPEPGAAGCLALSLTLMTGAALLPAVRLSGPAWYVLGCVAPGSALLAWVWRRRHQSGLWPYGVFLVSFVWIVCGFLLLPIL